MIKYMFSSRVELITERLKIHISIVSFKGNLVENDRFFLMPAKWHMCEWQGKNILLFYLRMINFLYIFPIVQYNDFNLNSIGIKMKG